MNKMRFETVDSHQHFWQVGLHDYPWMPTDENSVLRRDFLPDDLKPILQKCGVARTVLVQASNTTQETGWLLKLAKHFDFIAGVVGWVDLQSENVAEQIRFFKRNPKFKGVRHLVEAEPDDDWLVRKTVLRGLGELAISDLTFDLLVHPRHLRHVPKVAEIYPDLRFVIDHLAKPPIRSGEFDFWAGEIEAAARFENVFCKLSGLVTEADHADWKIEDLRSFVQHALQIFGARRLMFGSDYPVCLLAASYEQVFSAFAELLADLSDAERQMIFAENAVRFYRLNDS